MRKIWNIRKLTRGSFHLDVFYLGQNLLENTWNSVHTGLLRIEVKIINFNKNTKIRVYSSLISKNNSRDIKGKGLARSVANIGLIATLAL